jgi:hypothetical protein
MWLGRKILIRLITPLLWFTILINKTLLIGFADILLKTHK